jgi:hypothetical protein
VLNELCQLSEKFANEHDVKEILVDGRRPDQFAAAIIAEYERDKELNRVQKVSFGSEGETVEPNFLFLSAAGAPRCAADPEQDAAEHAEHPADSEHGLPPAQAQHQLLETPDRQQHAASHADGTSASSRRSR